MPNLQGVSRDEVGHSYAARTVSGSGVESGDVIGNRRQGACEWA